MLECCSKKEPKEGHIKIKVWKQMDPFLNIKMEVTYSQKSM